METLERELVREEFEWSRITGNEESQTIVTNFLRNTHQYDGDNKLGHSDYCSGKFYDHKNPCTGISPPPIYR